MFCAFWALHEKKKVPFSSLGYVAARSCKSRELMESCSSVTWERKMIAQAKEELQVLETQYPDRFDYLKLELKSFVFLLESQNLMLRDHTNGRNSSPTSTASTQASICGRKRKKSVSDEIEDTAGLKMQKGCSRLGRRDRVDVALERAQACLRKIQQLKTSL